jgi:hypothetical protein
VSGYNKLESKMVKVQRCIIVKEIGDTKQKFYALAVVSEYDGIVKRILDYNSGNIQMLQPDDPSILKWELLQGPLAYAQSEPISAGSPFAEITGRK